jgi:CheY-like chemotaxis protein
MPHTDAAPDARPGLQVLVVDDDRDGADSLAMLLELWGHRPRVAYDAEGALLAAADEPPDVVVVDLGLPGTDGFALAAELRARTGTRDAVFVAVTGHTVLAYRERAKECRFADVLIKPVEPGFLRQLLDDRQAALTPARQAVPKAAGHVDGGRRLVREPAANAGQSHRPAG